MIDRTIDQLLLGFVIGIIAGTAEAAVVLVLIERYLHLIAP